MGDKVKRRHDAPRSPLNGERAGVRGADAEETLISRTILGPHLPHLTLPSPLPPGAERECHRPPVAYSAILSVRGLDQALRPFPPDAAAGGFGGRGGQD
jgi:hypothetical protein